MKCFNLILLLLFFISNSIAQEAITSYPISIDGKTAIVERKDRVVPIDEKEIVNGEIYNVKIISDKTEEELRSYKNKMINAVMYVMDVKILYEERHFEIFVTDPPKKKIDDKKIIFDMSEFKYAPKNQGQPQEFYKIDTKFSLDKSSQSSRIVWMSFSGLILLFIAWFTRKYYLVKMKLRAKRKLKRKQAEDLLEKIQNAKSRHDFELIYLNRKEITKLLDFEKQPFLGLLNEINKRQYKKEWDDKDFIVIKDEFEKLTEFKVNRGI